MSENNEEKKSTSPSNISEIKVEEDQPPKNNEDLPKEEAFQKPKGAKEAAFQVGEPVIRKK
jgi:hypothetical protein